ncbi:MAG: hypothetical protein AAFP90_02025, partial [Planctomycetota bacterium]
MTVSSDRKFEHFPYSSQLLVDQSDRDFPSRLLGWNGGDVTMERDATHFGFVAEGQATIQWKR